jgi:NAD(P)-dependent dehydrogenase (short-subunit alcohol dehydrogenase family)
MSNLAVITGASRGLGLALARALAARGWSLVLDARGARDLEIAARLITEGAPVASSKIIAIPGDIGDPTHRAALREAVADRAVDALINNAGALGPTPRPALLDFPLEGLEALFGTNVTAQLGAVQEMRSALRDGAAILNITSDAAVEPYEGWGGYGASKAAFEHLSRILAAENPQWRVYQVDPGDMRTRMHQDAFPGEDISDRDPPEASLPGILDLIEGGLPSGRYAAKQLRPVSHRDGLPEDLSPEGISRGLAAAEVL